MSQHPAPTFAQSPFNNLNADFIIRSGDGVEFRVRSDILCEASPVFADIFKSNNCLSDKHDDASAVSLDGKPIIAVEEVSETLDPLLRLCYPTADPVLDLPGVRLVLAAAVTYGMDEAIALMKKAHRSYLESDPLRVWASACILRLEDEAREAAAALLGNDLPAKAPQEFNDLSSGDFYRLVKFHRTGGDVSESFKFWEPDPTDIKSRRRRHSRVEPVLAFQSRPYADIICRSSDGVDFLAHRIVLSLASPVLQDEIARTSSESPETPSGLHVLNIKCSASVVGPLLEMCYPVQHLNPDTLHLHQIVIIMYWARHYKTENVLAHLQRELNWTECVGDHPLSRYLLASRSGFFEWAQESLRSLRGDLYAYGYVPEMEITPAAIYHTLFINRREISAMMANATKTATPVAIVRARSQAAPTTEGEPWLLGLLQKMSSDLSNLGVGDPLSDLYPNIPALLRESVKKKIWCHNCRVDVKLLLKMQDVYERVSDGVYALERTGP